MRRKMITLNGRKFASNESELTGSLFDRGGTCTGYYKAYKKRINLHNLNHELIGVVYQDNIYAVSFLDGTKYYHPWPPQLLGGLDYKLGDQYSDAMKAWNTCRN